MALLGRRFTQVDKLSQGNTGNNLELGPSPQIPHELSNPPYRCGVEQDEEGRIVRKLEITGNERMVTEYAYDGASRLARVKVNGHVTEEYRYDDKGRRSYARLPETGSGQPGRYPRGLSFKYRDGDRLGGVGLGIRLEYDRQGRTVRYHVGGPELAYSAVDIEYADLPGPRGVQASIDLPTRLTYTEPLPEALRQKKARFATDPRYQDKQAKTGQTKSKRMETKVVAYTYDENAMRRSKLVGGKTIAVYSWLDPFRLDAIRVSWSRTPVHFHYADNARLPYSVTCQGTVLYLFYDHIGSLRAVANRNGDIVRKIEYESFGHVVGDTNPGLHLGYGFAGGLHDPDTGFVRFWVRDYDPRLGRFISPDPAWHGERPGRKAEGRARTAAEAGKQVVDPDRYGYCLDDPVNLRDLSGMALDWNDLVSIEGYWATIAQTAAKQGGAFGSSALGAALNWGLTGLGLVAGVLLTPDELADGTITGNNVDQKSHKYPTLEYVEKPSQKNSVGAPTGSEEGSSSGLLNNTNNDDAPRMEKRLEGNMKSILGGSFGR